MRIKVADVIANPFRSEGLPLNEGKVAQLVESIRTTGFWDNVVVRQSSKLPGAYELAYGHHRLEALRRCNVSEVGAVVKCLDDADMLAILSRENMEEWAVTPAVLHDTVLAAKTFIDCELERCKTLEEFKESPLHGYLVTHHAAVMGDERRYQTLRACKAGEPLIGAFTGLGSWNEKKQQWRSHRVQEALANLRASGRLSDPVTGEVQTIVEPEVIDSMPTLGRAVELRNEILKSGGASKAKQEKMAAKICGRTQSPTTKRKPPTPESNPGSSRRASDKEQRGDGRRPAQGDGELRRATSRARHLLGHLQRIQESTDWSTVASSDLEGLVDALDRLSREGDDLRGVRDRTREELVRTTGNLDGSGAESRA